MKCSSCGTDNPKDANICSFCSSPLATHPGTPFGKTEIHAPKEVASFPGGELIANRYQIIKELGRGGMGVVYYVKDTKLENKELALKMISPALVRSPEVLKRFIREVLTVQELDHKNIVRVFHLDEYNGSHFFTMEYLAGKSLREFIVQRNNDGRRIFSLKESISIIDPMLSALSHAHSRQVIHRDLKPENIIINGDFPEIDIKVVDFGLARIMSPSRLTSSAMSMGTAYYLSPEQLAGKEEVDERSDIFSLGVILYELLTGDIPSGRFPLPGELFDELPKAIDGIIDKVLASRPDHRYSSVTEFQNDIERCLSSGNLKKKHSNKRPDFKTRNRNKKAHPDKGTEQWDEEGFLENLLSITNGEYVTIAKQILSWAASNSLSIRGGKGQKIGTLHPTFSGQSLFRIEGTGKILVDFRHGLPPLKSPKEIDELFERLMALNCVSWERNVRDKWGRIELIQLKDEELNQFFEIFMWVLDKLKDTGIRSDQHS